MTPGELTDLIAKILDVPRTKVERVQTGIREAGLITKKGRGRSAAEMTFRDAAILLVGSVVSLPLTELLGAMQQIDHAPFKGVNTYDYTAPNQTRSDFVYAHEQQQSAIVAAHIVQSPNPFNVLANILRLASERCLFRKEEQSPDYHPMVKNCTMLIVGDSRLQTPTVMFDYQIAPIALPYSRFLINFGPNRDHRNWFGPLVTSDGAIRRRRRSVFGMWGIGIDTLQPLAEAMRGASSGY